MSLLRPVAATGLLAVSALVLIQPAGCGSKAVGINDCRDIESARCEAASHCAPQLVVDDVSACQRFYRDQCLHGLTAEDDPSSSAVRACVSAITSAGDCARDLGPATAIGECDELKQLFFDKISTVCDLVEKPQNTTACFFLNPGDDPPPTSGGEAGNGGDGGRGGSAANPFQDTAGTDGATGAAGTSPSAGAGS